MIANTPKFKDAIGNVIIRSQRIEELLQKHFGASGHGLKQVMDSIGGKLPLILSYNLPKVFDIRNRAAHPKKFQLNMIPVDFDRLCDEIECVIPVLAATARKQLETPKQLSTRDTKSAKNAAIAKATVPAATQISIPIAASVTKAVSTISSSCLATVSLHETSSVPEQEDISAAVLPANCGKQWTSEEEKLLIVDFEAGVSLLQLAFKLQRGVGGVRCRLEKLGKSISDPLPF